MGPLFITHTNKIMRKKFNIPELEGLPEDLLIENRRIEKDQNQTCNL